MRKLALFITIIAGVTCAVPAFAEDGGNAFPSRPAVTLAQLDLCIGPDCQGAYRERRHDEYYGRYDDDRRYRHGDDWRYRREDHCRDVTVRERRGDDVVVRRERRCD
jgi:hypothetical protein